LIKREDVAVYFYAEDCCPTYVRFYYLPDDFGEEGKRELKEFGEQFLSSLVEKFREEELSFEYVGFISEKPPDRWEEYMEGHILPQPAHEFVVWGGNSPYAWENALIDEGAVDGTFGYGI